MCLMLTEAVVLLLCGEVVMLWLGVEGTILNGNEEREGESYLNANTDPAQIVLYWLLIGRSERLRKHGFLILPNGSNMIFCKTFVEK